MSLKDKFGCEAKEAWIGDGQGAVRLEPPEGCKMVLENEYHGDRDENWLVCYGTDGKEAARHNLSYCSSVIWK